MPRRAKFACLITFFVIAALALMDIALHWHPKAPLRFSISPQQHEDFLKARGVRPSAILPALYIIAENVSDTTIVLYTGHVVDSNPSAHGAPRLYGRFSASRRVMNFADPVVRGEYWLIPPGGTVRCAVESGAGVTVPSLEGQDISVEYRWYSRSKRRYRDLCRWLRDHTPQVMHRCFPPPRLGDDATPLQPAPPGLHRDHQR